MRLARTIRTRVVIGACVGLLATTGAEAAAQQAPTQLTLDDAISLAKGFNPTFLSQQNDQAAADWQVREAYAQFVPSVTASLQGSWQAAGQQRFGTIVFDETTANLFSFYSVNLGLTLDGTSVFGVPNARANRRATEAGISAAEFNLESQVAFQYMAVLRGQDGVDVAQRQLERARQNLQIVNTRVVTGAAAGTEGRQAEVDLGRAEVTVIQAERDLRQFRLLLGEQTGVEIDEDVVLSSGFEVFEPDFDVDRLLEVALNSHPSLHAFEARESATRAVARQTASSQYLPSLRLNAQFAGQAQESINEAFVLGQAEDRAAGRISSCEFQNAIHNGIAGGLPNYTVQDCMQFALDDAGRAAALAQNNAFPFSFSPIPARISATFSLPIFTGFSRERQVSEARNLAEDAEHDRRAEELRLRTAVTGAYDNLVSAHRVVEAEARNRELAEEQLLLQQRRYALGAADLLLLMDAQTTLSTAEQAYLTAVYDFHYNLIALEASVGQTLRPR